MRSGTPYIADAKPEVSVSFFNISIVQVGNTYGNYASGGIDRRLVYLKTREEPYTGTAVIRLLNHDQSLSAINFQGTFCQIDWGWGGGTPSADQPYFIVDQFNYSLEGVSITELRGVSAWELLQKSKGINISVAADLSTAGVGSTRTWNRTTSVKDIINAIVTDTGGFLHQWGLDTLTTINAEPAGAGAIQTYSPQFFTRLGDDDAKLLRRLLQMSSSCLTFRAGTGPTLNYLNPAIPGPYYVYENNGSDHPFFEWTPGRGVVVPNRIFYVDQEPDPSKNQVARYVGSAQISMPIGDLADIFVDPSISSNAEADIRAAAHLVRAIAEADLGHFTAPMNCCQELYDEVSIIDTRSGINIQDRVGIIERVFVASSNNLETIQNQRDSYLCTIYLGGIGGGSTRTKSPIGGGNDVETTIFDLKARSLNDPFIDSYQRDGQILSQHLAPFIRQDTCSASETVSNGVVHTITGCSFTFNNPDYLDTVLEVKGTFEISAGAGVVAGDAFNAFLYVNGSQQGQPIVMTAASALDTKTLEKTWLVPVIPSVSWVIELRCQRQSGTGTWTVFLNTTDMITKAYESRNTIYS